MLALFALFVACAPETTITGSALGGNGLGAVGTAMWGGSYILFTDWEFACTDLAWVQSQYSPDTPPTELSFFGLQFTFLAGDPVAVGNFSVFGEAPVNARALHVDGTEFNDERARDGVLEVLEVEPEGLVEGTFDVEFTDGRLEGTFAAEYCVNLPD